MIEYSENYDVERNKVEALITIANELKELNERINTLSQILRE